MIAFSDEGPGADKQEWWRFNSGNLVEAGSSNANHHPCFWSLGIGLPCDWGMGFGSKEASSLEPMTILKMHDTKVPTGANQEIAEWSPQDYVVASNYPASRLAGGVGAAGSSIRDPTVILCWSFFLLSSISAVVYVLIYHREWFVPHVSLEEDDLMAPLSPRSVGSV